MKNVIAAVAVMALTGCASIVNDSTHGMRIETKTPAGETVTGAECSLVNDYGTTTTKSGTTQAVRRSSKDMDITCVHPSQPPATGRAISRANAGLAGNIIFGGAIGAVIDHSKGTAYTYPTWIQLVFGQSLVFDRSEEQEGKPLVGRAPGAPSAASERVQSNLSSMACSQGAAPCK